MGPIDRGSNASRKLQKTWLQWIKTFDRPDLLAQKPVNCTVHRSNFFCYEKPPFLGPVCLLFPSIALFHKGPKTAHAPIGISGFRGRSPKSCLSGFHGDQGLALGYTGSVSSQLDARLLPDDGLLQGNRKLQTVVRPALGQFPKGPLESAPHREGRHPLGL